MIQFVPIFSSSLDAFDFGLSCNPQFSSEVVARVKSSSKKHRRRATAAKAVVTIQITRVESANAARTLVRSGSGLLDRRVSLCRQYRKRRCGPTHSDLMYGIAAKARVAVPPTSARNSEGSFFLS